MSNFFISIGFLITAIQIFINKKIVRAYDGVDYSIMGDFYLVPGIASLVGVILFFWLGCRSIKLKNRKKEFECKWCNSCSKSFKVSKDTLWCHICGKPLAKFNDKDHKNKVSKKQHYLIDHFGNFIYDPRTWTYGIALEEIVNGYLSPEPPTNGLQAIGGGINKIVEMYNK